MSDAASDQPRYTQNATRSDVAVVVVHHDSILTVGRTVQSVLAAGALPRNVFLIDNSGAKCDRDEIAEAISPVQNLVRVKNAGYAAAVNEGVRCVKSIQGIEYVIVATHEVVLDRDAIDNLVSAVQSAPDVGVVGPLLRTDGRIWSAGGRLSKILRVPYHLDHGSDWTESGESDVIDVEWVDGALMLYRSEALYSTMMCEDYILYTEEVDHHQRLRESGWRVLIDRGTTVEQSSNGVPDYFLIRNIRIFQRRNGTMLGRLFAPPILGIRRALRALVRDRDGFGKSLKAVVAGFFDLPYDPATAQFVRRIVIINPVGGAMHHYVRELCSVLRAMQLDVVVYEQLEPSLSGRSRISWACHHLWTVLRRSRPTSTTRSIVVWPAAGYWDLAVVGLVGRGYGRVVIHDPVPLVKSLGYGRVAKQVAAYLGRGSCIVHSVEAATQVPEKLDAAQVPHPILVACGVRSEPVLSSELSDEDSLVNRVHVREVRRRAKPLVLVFGQYKVDRDIPLMEEIASELGDRCDLRVVGRGWPAVLGWEVKAAFIAEREVTRLLESADVVLVPYRRFFQSGVALRCVECGTPVVAPVGSSAATLLESAPELLAGPTAVDWVRAIEAAIDMPPERIDQIRAVYEANTLASWGKVWGHAFQ